MRQFCSLPQSPSSVPAEDGGAQVELRQLVSDVCRSGHTPHTVSVERQSQERVGSCVIPSLPGGYGHLQVELVEGVVSVQVGAGRARFLEPAGLVTKFILSCLLFCVSGDSSDLLGFFCLGNLIFVC